MSISRNELVELSTMAALATAAYSDGSPPPGWSYINLFSTDLPRTLHDGTNYSNSGANAAVLTDASGRIVISLRGTDPLFYGLISDLASDLNLARSADYWRKFEPLLSSILREFPNADITFVGHSLGGAAVHQIAGQVSAGALPFLTNALFYSFASPLLNDNDRVVSFGHANDTVFGLIADGAELASDFSDIWINAAIYGITQNLVDFAPHSMLAIQSSINRLLETAFFSSYIDLSRPIILNVRGVLTVPEVWPGNRIPGSIYVLGLDTPIEGQSTSVNDIIIGRDSHAGWDRIDGMAGNDRIEGLGGTDEIFGGYGNDSLFGGEDDDVLEGADGHDALSGGEGADLLFGGTGADTVDGGEGPDILFGGAGNDVLSAGDTTTLAVRPSNYLFGGAGQDTLIGGEGNNYYLMTPQDRDTIVDSGRFSTVWFSSYELDLDHTHALLDSLRYGDPLPYVSNTAQAFVIDNNLFQSAFHFTSVDSARSIVTIDVSDLPEHPYNHMARTLFLGNGGSTVTFENFSSNVPYVPNSSLSSITFNIHCGAGADEIVLADGLLALAAQNRDVGQIIISIHNFDPSEDILILNNPFREERYNDLISPEPLGIYFVAIPFAYNYNFHNDYSLDRVNTGHIFALIDIVEDSSTPSAGEHFLGGTAHDSMLGGVGNDTLIGSIGNDTLNGGTGNDVMSGGVGDDVAIVDNAADIVIEHIGDGTRDQVASSVTYALFDRAEVEFLTTTDSAGTSAIHLTGNDFEQTITGNAGSNQLSGWDGNDVLNGLGGDDSLYGGGGADSMVGGAGNDVYFVSRAGDIIVETAGNGNADAVRTYSSYVLQSGVDVEIFSIAEASGTSAFNLMGNGHAQTITANAGNNLLSDGGGTGADTLIGLAGNDTYVVGNAGTIIVEGAGDGSDDRVTSNVSFVLAVDDHIESLSTSALLGTTSINLTGNALAQGIFGNAAANTLDGGGGADTLSGGAGNDTLIVRHTATRIDEGAGLGTSDRILAAVSFAMAVDDNIEVMQTISASGTTAINLTGNTLAQSITGNAGNNILSGGGGGGNDSLYGGDGNDLLTGGIGNDRIDGGLGSDRAYFTGPVAATVNLSILTAQVTGYGTDTLAGIEHLSSGSGNDRLTGDTFGNSLVSGAGNDTVDSGAGNDALYGGDGNDLMFGGIGNDRIDGGLGADRAYFTGTVAATVNLSVLTAQVTGYGTDTLVGIEHLSSGSGNDRLTGDALGNSLVSGAGNDTVNGAAGNDALYGGAGNDLLTGGAGNDRFSYAAQNEAGDRVSDFIAADDTFVFQTIGFNVFQAGSFNNLVLGTLNAANFRIGSTNIAADGNDFFIFRTTDTTLWFDADGNGTQRSAILIADLQTGATMSAADVLLI